MPPRRHALLGAGVVPAVLLLAATVVTACGDAVPTRKPPHVVLYLVDTLRADRLGCYGYEHDTSPFVDELAAGSARFDRALAQAPWTLPSVVSLLTSSHPISHKVTSVGLRVPSEVMTLAEVLDAQGYTTVGYVYNKLGGSDGGLEQGYDQLYEPPNVREMTDADRARGATTLRPFFDWFERQTIDAPHFFYIHTLEPHWPYEGRWSGREPMTPDEEARKRRLNQMVQKHRGLVTRQSVAERGGPPLEAESAALLASLTDELRLARDEVEALYAGDVRHADEKMRRFVAALKRKGMWDDTVFILVADHGEEFYDHGNWFHGQSVHDELVRVPLIVRIPGITDAGTSIAAPVQLVDVAPTITDLLGIEAPADWQGRSLLPQIRGGGRPQPAFTMRINSNRGAANTRDEGEGRETAIQRGRYKAILNHMHRSVRLFDVVSDPGERVDLAAGQPQLAEELRQVVFGWLTETGRRAYPAPDEVTPGPTVLEALEELGY